MQLLQEHPLLRTDSYAKIFLYNTHETVACVPRHTIRMSEPVRPGCLQQAVEKALLRFPHMMLTVQPTATSFRYVQNVRPPVVLPFDGADRRYTIGSDDTNGYLFLVGYQGDTITMEYQHSISDGRGFEEFIRCVLLQYLQLSGKPVENDGSVRAMDTRYSPEESADGYRQLADREFSSEGIWKKPEAAHAWDLTDLGDGPEIVSEVTFPFAALHSYAKGIGVSPLSVVAPLFMRAFDHKFGGEEKAGYCADPGRSAAAAAHGDDPVFHLLYRSALSARIPRPAGGRGVPPHQGVFEGPDAAGAAHVPRQARVRYLPRAARGSDAA
ncbi:hypothetical protein RWV98_16550 [Agathobaculum sp. NTUH-O15-33]|uniref:hypothetical protein n=1 Tax=Agathobaculum sp. NTUH-O15-33 TaxID=3079302 RepID=UPI002958CD81|nr:hypothetical protein [Agathobaculum sp. NTUH-O15-33]WNX84164.1 hypothetical protein RWV98_16550 [Agathobaculum sp. NTUH-O15-33]